MIRKMRSRDGRWTRREALEAMGALGALALVGCGDNGPMCNDGVTPACTVTPTGALGPYFVDEKLNRSDLTQGTTDPNVVNGLPLTLNFTVQGVCNQPCPPIAGAQVDVWHANAAGLYSDEKPLMSQTVDTTGTHWLRGYQLTDANGQVSFKTIFPGWYLGRTVHVHVKVRKFRSDGTTLFDYVTLLLFDDKLTDMVMSMPPYNARGPRQYNNFNDPNQQTWGVTPYLISVTQPSPPALVGNFTIGISTAGDGVP